MQHPEFRGMVDAFGAAMEAEAWLALAMFLARSAAAGGGVALVVEESEEEEEGGGGGGARRPAATKSAPLTPSEIFADYCRRCRRSARRAGAAAESAAGMGRRGRVARDGSASDESRRRSRPHVDGERPRSHRRCAARGDRWCFVLLVRARAPSRQLSDAREGESAQGGPQRQVRGEGQGEGQGRLPRRSRHRDASTASEHAGAPPASRCSRRSTTSSVYPTLSCLKAIAEHAHERPEFLIEMFGGIRRDGIR